MTDFDFKNLVNQLQVESIHTKSLITTPIVTIDNILKLEFKMSDMSAYTLFLKDDGTWYYTAGQ